MQYIVSTMDECTFCHDPITGSRKTVKLRTKGCKNIAKCAVERGQDISVQPGQIVHSKCRSDFINPKDIKLSAKKRKHPQPGGGRQQTKVLRSGPFSYKEQCVFCGQQDPYNGRKTNYKLIPVRNLDFQEKILKTCGERNDGWSENVKRRVQFVHDLPAADAVYHSSCNINFRTGKTIPMLFQKQRESHLGRPKDSVKERAFESVIDYLKGNDDEQITINDLIEKMADELKGTNTKPYGFTHMKNRLKTYLGDEIIIAEINGKENVVTFMTTVSKILSNFHKQSTHIESEEKSNIIEAAAKLIKQDIKDIDQPKDFYPGPEDLTHEKALQFLPQSLHKFLQIMISGKDSCKLASIGQALMQAVRPRRIIAPLQVALGVQMHHVFQSKFLVDSLYQHGFTCSYSEVRMSCKCRAHGLECTLACGECHGVCSNSLPCQDDIDDE